jgi:hypothetical protein
MLICTNDGFGGLDSIRLPKWVGDSTDHPRAKVLAQATLPWLKAASLRITPMFRAA